MSCGSELAWYDNVPVASWLWLRGRCRSCGTSISARYPAVELATAALVAACFVKFGFSGEAFLAAFFCVVLVALSAIDLEHRIVPNRDRNSTRLNSSHPSTSYVVFCLK